MASPKYVYPWWGRNTVDDPEKWLMTLKNIYTKLDNTRKLIPGRENHPEEKKGKAMRRKKHLVQNYTNPCANMLSSSDDSTAV
jgi:hypothetical protein